MCKILAKFCNSSTFKFSSLGFGLGAESTTLLLASVVVCTSVVVCVSVLFSGLFSVVDVERVGAIVVEVDLNKAASTIGGLGGNVDAESSSSLVSLPLKENFGLGFF